MDHTKYLMMGKANEVLQDFHSRIAPEHTDDIGYRTISDGSSERSWCYYPELERTSFHLKPATAPHKISDKEWEELSEELSKSRGPLMESYRKTWNQQVQQIQRKQ